MVKKFNCSPRRKDVVFIPSRKHLLPILYELSTEIVDRIIPLDELIDKIGLFLSDRFRVDVMHATSQTALPGSMLINADYDQEKDEKNKVSIQIILITYTNEQSFLWDDEQCTYVCKQIADTIIHEMVHMKQCRARDFEDYFFEKDSFESGKEEAQYYLGNNDEIDAYAYNIASELLDQGDFKQANLALSCPSKITLETSANLWAYMNTFDYNVDHPAIRKLIKKIYKHLTHLN